MRTDKRVLLPQEKLEKVMLPHTIQYVAGK